jgi:hypothetical protein
MSQTGNKSCRSPLSQVYVTLLSFVIFPRLLNCSLDMGGCRFAARRTWPHDFFSATEWYRSPFQKMMIQNWGWSWLDCALKSTPAV